MKLSNPTLSRRNKNLSKHQNDLGFYSPTQYSSDEAGFGGLFDDFKAQVQQTVQKTVDKGEAKLQSYVGEEYTAKIGDVLEKQRDVLVEKGQNLVLQKAGEYAGQKEVQDSAITSGVQATAEQISQGLINIKDTYNATGITGLFKKYPIPFYATGGIIALLTARFVLGGKKYVVKSNPRKKSKSKSRKRKNPMKGLTKAQKARIAKFKNKK